MAEFTAQIADSFMRHGKTLYLWRRVGNRIEYLAEDGTWARADERTVGDVTQGFHLPMDAWDAIVRIAAPHADAGEVKELRAALELERSRVEKLIDRSLGG